MNRRAELGARLLSGSLDQLVRRGLRGVWVQGRLPAGPVVWAANHHSWWDGFVASAVLSELGRPGALLMQADNLDRFRFLAPLGVIATGRPRQALQALRAGRVLVIFPERDLRAPGPVGPLAPGAAWFAEQAPAVLVPVAVRISNRGHQYPEAYVDLGEPVAGAQLATALADRLARLDARLTDGDPRQPLPGYHRLVSGRRSWDERLQRWSRARRR